jgi:hypothetical protein
MSFSFEYLGGFEAMLETIFVKKGMAEFFDDKNWR